MIEFQEIDDARFFETGDESRLDERLKALAHQRRRRVLRCLEEEETPLTLAALANEVAKRERNAPRSEVPAEAVEEVRVSLYHLHLPRLKDVGLVAYNREADSIALAPEFRRER